MKRPILTLLGLAMLCNAAYTNNIQVSNVGIASQNTEEGYYMISFDLSWENSWRTSTLESNWDAAWVFIKFSPLNQHNWQHAWLNYNNGTDDGHNAPSGCTITTAQNTGDDYGMGVLVYRDSDGIGNIDFHGIQLRWNYVQNGISSGDPVEVSVHAIEMVYVPEGSFFAGDGASSAGNFEAGNSGSPFEITSEGQITLGGTSTNNLSNHDALSMPNPDDFDYSTTRTLPAAFPKGFDAFYCMKYEVSQSQYATFLELLTPQQRDARGGPFYVDLVDVFPIAHGNHYAIAQSPARAMTYTGWLDMAAYLEWSGLRPMSELEYEKACRGPLPPIPGELAWGNNSWFLYGHFELENEGTENELIAGGIGVGTGNANTSSAYYGGYTPLRCGIFAASAVNKTREETGASYWGIMEMTGNTYEFTISVGTSQTRDFSGKHGDGTLNGTGNASLSTLQDWALGGATGLGYRNSTVSYRYSANLNDPNRAHWYGIRGIRSAP